MDNPYQKPPPPTYPDNPDITTARTKRRPDQETLTAACCPKCKSPLWGWFRLRQATPKRPKARRESLPQYLYCRTCQHFIDARVQRELAREPKGES